jgi:hypothetical protein
MDSALILAVPLLQRQYRFLKLKSFTTMAEHNMQQLMKINQHAAASIFTSPVQSKIVQTLIGEASTLARLARSTQIPLSLLHYHVAKCLKLGLLKVERLEQRSGRPVKHYRATARTFFVPAKLLTRLPGAELTAQLREALDRNQGRSVSGVNFTHDGNRPCVFLVKDRARQSSAIELWLDIGLSNSNATALIDELKAVLERYRQLDDKSESRYLVHMAAAKCDSN